MREARIVHHRLMDSAAGVVFELVSVGPAATFTLSTGHDRTRSYLARIEAHAFSAAVEIALSRPRFAEFFASMARNWRGWPGAIALQAHRPGLDYGGWAMSLRATSDQRGHVRVAVDFGEPWIDPEPSEFETHSGFPASNEAGAWVARITLFLEAGQLDAIAADATALPYDCAGPK
jgi:hypothetical protein